MITRNLSVSEDTALRKKGGGYLPVFLKETEKRESPYLQQNIIFNGHGG